MLFQYANEANPRAHYDGTGAEIARDLAARRRARRRARHRRDADGRRPAAARGVSRRAGRRRRAAPGDPVMGLRSLEDGYVPPVLDVSQLDRKLLVSNAEAAAAARALLEREGIFAGVSSGAVVHVARRDRGGAARRRGRRRRARRRRLEVPVGAVLERRGDRRGGALVVIPAAIREELRAHAADEAPNECCGLVLVQRRRRRSLHPRRQQARVAVPVRAVHRPVRLVARSTRTSSRSSSTRIPETEPRPSRTDRELAGLWCGRPFLIYGLARDELRAWRVSRDEVELPLTTCSVVGPPGHARIDV